MGTLKTNDDSSSDDESHDPQDSSIPQPDLEYRVRNGDQTAMADLFNRHRKRLRKIVATRLDGRLKGRVDPSDVLQEAFLELAKRLSKFSDRNDSMSVFVWMRLVATESVINTHRAHLTVEKRDVRREQPMQIAAPSATSLCLAENMLAHYSSAGNKVIRNELQKILMKTLGEMDPMDQEIILMRDFEGLTNMEAAEVLGLSQNGASNRYVRAMTRLHTELKSIPGFM